MGGCDWLVAPIQPVYQQCARDRTYLKMMGRSKVTFQDEDKSGRVWRKAYPLTPVLRLLVRWPKPGMVSPFWILQSPATEWIPTASGELDMSLLY